MTQQGIEKFVKSIETNEAVELNWGRLNWLITGDNMPGTELTFGICTIHPGQRNPLHSHPNCEELLYVVSGRCEHLLGEEKTILEPGSVIQIPTGVKHWAKNIGDEPVVAVIVFSSPVRQAVTHEGSDIA